MTLAQAFLAGCICGPVTPVQAFLAGCICGAGFILLLQLWHRRRSTPRLDADDSIAFAGQCERVIARSGRYSPEQLRALRAHWRDEYTKPGRAW